MDPQVTSPNEATRFFRELIDATLQNRVMSKSGISSLYLLSAKYIPVVQSRVRKGSGRRNSAQTIFEGLWFPHSGDLRVDTLLADRVKLKDEEVRIRDWEMACFYTPD